MSKSNTYEADLLKLLFNATPIANVADNAASSPLANLYLALHTADPTDTGDQTTNEVSYTGYARVAVVRTTAGFTISGTSPTQAALANNEDFPVCTSAGPVVATYFSVGKLSSGAGEIYYSGPISPTITITSGVIPRLTTGTICTED